jgi:hypothetical protein
MTRFIISSHHNSRCILLTRNVKLFQSLYETSRYEDVRANGGRAPRILNLGTRPYTEMIIQKSYCFSKDA